MYVQPLLTRPDGLIRKFGLAAGAVAAADALIYQAYPGLNVGLAAAIVFALLILDARTEGRSIDPKSALLLPALSLPALLENVSFFPVCFTVLSAAAIALSDRIAWFHAPADFLKKVFALYVRALLWLCPDAITALRTIPINQAGASALGWLVPIVCSVFFIGLFAMANPLLDHLVARLAEVDVDFEPDILRLFFWVGIMIMVWPPLRRRFADTRRPIMQTQPFLDTINLPAAAPTRSLQKATGHAVVLRSLFSFNVIFALQSLSDVIFLVGGAALPTGMSYGDYAHRGAYPLVVAALCAGLFVVVAIRPGSVTERDPRVRQMVYLWLAQTLLLLVTSLWRLAVYVDIYSLTYLRVAAFIWMGIVGLGLVWTILRLAFGRSNTWLVNVNVLTVLAVLHGCCFVDFGAAIARYNADKALKSAEKPLDLSYMAEIGTAAIPALDKIAAKTDVPLAKREQAAQSSVRLRRRHARITGDWRAYTFRRFRLSRYIAENPAPEPSRPPAQPERERPSP
ncbi:MAG: DUF4153 domain-containing protein [Pseudomonadota bacterium]